MIMDVYTKGIYKVIRIKDSLNAISNLKELEALIIGYLKNHENHIAVSFTDATYLYSGAVSVLVNCYKMVKESDGDLCVIEPNSQMLELLKQMNINSIITLYSSERELPDSPFSE